MSASGTPGPGFVFWFGLFVLIDDASVPGALVADEEDGAAIGAAGVDAVGDEAVRRGGRRG